MHYTKVVYWRSSKHATNRQTLDSTEKNMSLVGIKSLAARICQVPRSLTPQDMGIFIPGMHWPVAGAHLVS